MMTLDNALWLAGILSKTILVGLLFYKRVWRTLPVFSAFCAWDLISDAANFVILRSFHSSYLTVYSAEIALGSVLEFGVLVELAWSILRPIRTSLTRRALYVVVALILGIGGLVWPFSGIQQQTDVPSGLYFMWHLEQTDSILRVLFFLALVAGSQVLSIGWRDRELQIATGLGFYSLVSLGAAMLRTHQTTVAQFGHLNQVVVASYVCSISFWIYCFAQKEAERREFTPQMRSLLLAMAGVARANRISLSESRNQNPRDLTRP